LFSQCDGSETLARKGAQARIDNSTKEQRQAWAKKSRSRALAEEGCAMTSLQIGKLRLNRF